MTTPAPSSEHPSTTADLDGVDGVDGTDQPVPARRRRTVPALLALCIGSLGLVGASAASLGGITTPDLGADTTVVASCDSDGVSLSYVNSYDATSGAYRTTSVTVSGIDVACNGLSLSLTLKDNAGAALASGTVATIAGTSATVTLGGSGAAADAVEGAALIIAA